MLIGPIECIPKDEDKMVEAVDVKEPMDQMINESGKGGSLLVGNKITNRGASVKKSPGTAAASHNYIGEYRFKLVPAASAIPMAPNNGVP